jgi:PKD repeat protein
MKRNLSFSFLWTYVTKTGKLKNLIYLSFLVVFTIISNAQSVTNPTVLFPLIQSDAVVGCQTFDTTKRGDFMLIPEDQCLKVCENSTVTYSVVGSIGSSYVWNNGGSATVIGGNNLNQYVVKWGSATTSYIEVTEILGGLSATKRICIEIVKTPTASFGVAGYSVRGMFAFGINACLNQPLQFQDNSSSNGGSNILSWNWDFGDGNTSSEQNPIHAYSSPGTYTASLYVTNECNCKSKLLELTIIVSREPSPELKCHNIVCEGGTARYEIIAPNCNTNQWTVTGGKIINCGTCTLGSNSASNTSYIEVLWDNIDNNGFGYINYTPNCRGSYCNNTISFRIPVIKKAVQINGPTEVCVGKQYLLVSLVKHRYVLFTKTNYPIVMVWPI